MILFKVSDNKIIINNIYLTIIEREAQLMNYLNEMEYLSQEMKMQKNIMIQSDKDLLEEKQI